MSKSKNAIAEIKKLMTQFGFMNEEQTLLSFKLKDNTIVELSDIIVGNPITKISDDYQRVSLEDGTFRLSERFEVEVKDGKINHVREIFLDAVLEDGTKIKVEGEELIEGAKVMVVTEDALLPAPDGVHLLDDKKTKVETKDGVIVSIVSEEPMGDDAAVIEDDVESEVGDIEMYDMLKKMLEKISEKMKKMEEKMEKVEAEFKAFKKEPAAKPIPNGKTEFSKNDSTEDSKVKAILQMRNNLI